VLNGQVVLALLALIERLLALDPEARGTAREAAEAAEALAEYLEAAAVAAPDGLDHGGQ
jgi:hypothetical protein